MKELDLHVSPRPPDASALITYFERHHMFRVLPRDELARLAEEVMERRYRKGQHLCYAGDQANAVFIVRSGLLALTEADERGNPYAVHTFGPGDVFGTMVTLLDVAYTGAAIAMSDTIAVVIRKPTFGRLVRLYPDLAIEIIRELYQIVCRAEQTIGRLAMSRVAARVAAFLLTSAGSTPAGSEPASFELGLSHQDMAVLVGTTRRTVTRVFTRLSRDKMIATKGRKVSILQTEALRHIAES